MSQARSKTSATYTQIIADGEIRPDNERFTILALNPQSAKTRRTLTNVIKSYLEWHFHMVKEGELQYVGGYSAKVSTLFHHLQASAHTLATP